MNSNLQNHFLVAMPVLRDTFFYRSVVYLCMHDQNGATGLIINRPTKIMLKELLAHLKIQNESSDIKHMPVLFGGPVQQEQGMVLHDEANLSYKSSLPISENIFLTTSIDILAEIGTERGPKHALVTLGYAGWGAGQLEQELAENSWLTVPANQDLLFDTPAEDCWQAAAGLLGVDINLMFHGAGHA